MLIVTEYAALIHNELFPSFEVLLYGWWGRGVFVAAVVVDGFFFKIVKEYYVGKQWKP